MVSDYQKELVAYFQKNISKGYTIDSLKITLVKQGYPKVAIDKAIKAVNEELARQAPLMRESSPAKIEVVEETVPARKSFFKRLFGL